MKPFAVSLKAQDAITLSSIFSGDVSVAATVPKKVPVTAMDFAEIVSDIKIQPTLKMTNLAKGIKNWRCPWCEGEYEHIEAAQANMVYVSIKVDHFTGQIVYDESATQERCQQCCDDAAYIDGFDILVDHDIAVWSDFWEVYFIAHDCDMCEYCSEPHPYGSGKDNWVFDYFDSSPVGCVACIPDSVLDMAFGIHIRSTSPHLITIQERTLTWNVETNLPEYVPGTVYYATELTNAQPLCRAFYEITAAEGKPLSSLLCNACGENTNCNTIVLNGTPATSNTLSLV
jgi:hypothetical protein